MPFSKKIFFRDMTLLLRSSDVLLPIYNIDVFFCFFFSIDDVRKSNPVLPIHSNIREKDIAASFPARTGRSITRSFTEDHNGSSFEPEVRFQCNYSVLSGLY